MRGLRAAEALIFVAAISLFGSAATAEPRIALVLTNQAYTQPGTALTNTHRDGDLIAAALRKVGFSVTVVRDTKSEGELRLAISAHADRIAKAGPDAVGFLYYSGHGAADGPTGANYIIPTRAPLTHVRDLTLSAVPLDSITRMLARVGRMNFIVFDACRTLTLQRDTKDFGFKGLVPVAAPDEVLIAFATDRGNVAVDQSLYARALADELVKPGLEANEVFRNVRRAVSTATKNSQRPETFEQRTHNFHFAAAVAPRPVAAPAPQASQQDPPRPFAGSDPNGASPVSVPPPSPKRAVNDEEFVRSLQAELKRVGCYDGVIDGSWGTGSKSALEAFGRIASTAVAADDPSAETLLRLKRQVARVCPPRCDAQEVLLEGNCVAKPAVKTTAKPPPQPAAVAPQSNATDSIKPKAQPPKAVPPVVKSGGAPHGIEVGGPQWRSLVPCESREYSYTNELCRRPNGVVCSTMVSGNRRIPVDCRS